MDRSGWVAWAWVATLIGVVVAANGFVILGQMVDVMEDQSRAQPFEGPWYAPLATLFAFGALGLQGSAGAVVTYGWAKTRAKKRQSAPVQVAKDADDPDDRIVAPPGFGGPAVRTKRAGALPLLAWSATGLLVLVGGLALAALGLMTLDQTGRMDGRGLSQAMLWGRLVRYLAAPLVVLGTGLLGMAWGRWFPLGALEVVETKAEAQRPLTARWQRHD